jgi:hypothetical protein
MFVMHPCNGVHRGAALLAPIPLGRHACMHTMTIVVHGNTVAD